MKIYTKTGDSGFTGLIGGTRIEKCNPQIDVYGTIDELNAFIGLLVAKLHNKSTHISFLQNIQRILFDVGAYLATDFEKYDAEKFAAKINDNFIQSIENEIDKIGADLPPLKSFIIPSGTETSAMAHICRTVTRRAERKILFLNKKITINKQILVFINRLSDYFFVLARNLNFENQTEENFTEKN
ncbi:MAG: cob(I)yrinic acid a,c-diamide adenosyltransferase [Paludibacter sp.]|nr:cob(I)yrinic acid a,c-diamide adenosyltransferase [Paludibacter sp.]